MPMSSGLTSTLTDFTRRSEFANNPLAAGADGASSGPAKPGLLSRIRAWFGKLGRGIGRGLRMLVPSMAFVRYLIAFGVGIAATLTWQAYGSTARTAVAGWSPRLAWLAPPAASRGVSADRIKATSQALAAVHQSVDKLATEVSKLETQAGTAAPAEAAAPAASRRSSRRQ
jgi:hypothetical protein